MSAPQGSGWRTRARLFWGLGAAGLVAAVAALRFLPASHAARSSLLPSEPVAEQARVEQRALNPVAARGDGRALGASATERPASAPAASAPAASAPALPPPAVSPPEPIEPPFRSVAAAGDGAWTGVADPDRPAAELLMYRTTLHPDPGNPRSELFVVSMPAARVELHAVAGTLEPATSNPAAQRIENRGIIPDTDRVDLLAGFNGGFRAEHGHHGMMVQGVVLIPPRPDRCTIFGYADGSVQIRSFQPEPPGLAEPLWYRQTSRCLVEQGQVNSGLRDARTTAWGAALGGETSIRRSALGSTRDGTRLLVAVSNFTTARAIAVGMQWAGGWNVAQLDVNWSFPKFLLFPRDAAGQRFATSLFNGFTYKPEDMLQKPSTRDFFYVVRKPRGG